MVMSRVALRTIFLIFWVVSQAVCLAGQLQPSTPPDSAQVAGPSATGEGAPERPASWKLLPPNILHDQKNIWLFPARLAVGKHWKPALGVVTTTAALVALDPHDTPYFRRTASFDNFNKVLSGRNTSLGMAIVPASFYVAALVRKDTYAEHTALLAGEAFADAEALGLVMKDVSLRLRPSDISPQGNFADTWFAARGSVFGKHSSFPSGHTFTAFSIATVFAERYRKHRWVPWVSYGLAGLVGFSRISLQSHFPSDVFVGAALGYFISRDVVLRNH
jgi:membrane-associated phospholipid phosphatase